MSTSRSRWLALSIAALGALVAAACTQAAHDTQGAGPSCKSDCGSDAVGGGGTPSSDGGASSSDGGSSSDAGADAAAAATDVTVTVAEYGEPTFATADAYQGKANVVGPKASGGDESVPYGGNDGTTITLKGITEGPTWLFVEDAAAGQTGIFSTYSAHSLPAAGTVTLPVVSRPLLTAILSKLPVPGVIDDSRAHVLFRFRRAGALAAGIKPVTAPASATVVFDNGVGVFTTDAKATSTGGMILLLNNAVGGGGSTITVEFADTTLDAGAPNRSVTVPIATGAASFVDVDLSKP
jgi:hypothetical protein